MADIEHTHHGVAPGERAPETGAAAIGRIINVAGALVSLALVAGIGVWGYKLLIRDVSGVPVVRALKGEMRAAPLNPGGLAADNQGLAVNAVAAQGSAAAPADRLRLAPGPVRLAEEDQPVNPTAASAAVRPRAKPGAAADPGAVAAFQQGDAGAVDALVRQLVAAAAPGPEPGTGPIIQPEALDPSDGNGAPERLVEEDDVTGGQAIDPADLPDLAGPGLKRSLRPRLRPERLSQATPGPADAEGADLSAALATAVQTSGGIDLDPDSLRVGTRLAQLGAYDSPELAGEQWDQVVARFEDYFDGKARVIQEASSGGRTFYRLRVAGFDDLSDARRFCAALVAKGAECIPVTLR